MSQIHTPFRYDYVGSFLRPQKLKEAREKFEKKEISHDELKAVEDESIRELIEKQKKAGYHVITDGEFRRAYWHLDFFWGFNGISHQHTDKGVVFNSENAITRPDTVKITGKISGENHPFVEDFKFVKAQEDENTVAKQTIPSPTQLVRELLMLEHREDNHKIYPDEKVLFDDVVRAYRQVIQDLYDAGCRNLQLDDCTWAIFSDRTKWNAYDLDEKKYAEKASEAVELNNRVLADWPDDLFINTHVCRGNFCSNYGWTGDYSLEAPYLFAKENVNAFYLEYDDARAGGFEPLKYVTEGKKVVLGLITSKRPELEDENTVIRRIHDAARYVPLENLYLSPQCGFASVAQGNKLTEEDQWAKLALVKKIAEKVWKDAE